MLVTTSTQAATIINHWRYPRSALAHRAFCAALKSFRHPNDAKVVDAARVAFIEAARDVGVLQE
jgi:hypothetical protein